MLENGFDTIPWSIASQMHTLDVQLMVGSTLSSFGWLANHFAKLVKIRPVVLLVDGHSSHIDIEV